MSDIVLTAALRNNLLSLQNTQRLIDTTQQRLATGLKVNSALDNPSSFFAAQSLNDRASDLGRLLDGIGQSIRTIEEADKGITALTQLVQQAESIADNAQAEIRASEGFARISGTGDVRALGGNIEDGVIINNGASDRFRVSVTTITSAGVATTTLSADIDIGATDTVDNIVAAINSDANIGANRVGGALVRASVGSGGNLVIESLSEGALLRLGAGSANTLSAAGFARLGLDNVVGTETNVATTRNGGTAIAGREIYSKVTASTAVNGSFEASALLGNGAGQAGFLDNAGTDSADLVLTIDGTTINTGTITDTNSIQDLLDNINNNVTDGSVVASFDQEIGRIVLTVAEDVGQVTLEFQSNNTSTNIDFGFGTSATSQAFTAATDASSEVFSFVGSSADLAQFQSDFNNIREQIDGIVEDANYRGVNLLSGDDLTTFFNEDRSNELVTDGADFSSAGLGISEADFTTAADVQASLDDVRTALESVRNFGQTIANDLAIIQTRRDFTEDTINTLQAGADDLTVADSNEEGANLLALQTRQALGTTALSLASQSAQSVLRLF